MKILLVTAAIASGIASCNSKKPSPETGPAIVKDTATATAAADTSHPDIEKKEPELGGIGELNLGTTHTKVVELLGEPSSKSKAEEWGADGLMHQDWMYKNKGITLNMSSGKDITRQDVNSITITSPCDLKTNKNIGIGSSYTDVITAYEKDIDKAASTKDAVIVGSIYGGIFFDFLKDKVVKIFVGAGAE